jgi:hypothetical protein
VAGQAKSSLVGSIRCDHILSSHGVAPVGLCVGAHSHNTRLYSDPSIDIDYTRSRSYQTHFYQDVLVPGAVWKIPEMYIRRVDKATLGGG